MSNKFFQVLFTVILAVTLTACEPAALTNSGITSARTDQGDNTTKKVDSRLYYLTLQLNDNVQGYNQTKGSISGIAIGGYGLVSGAIWTDGKGLVRGTIIRLSPSISSETVGDEIIVKTTDFKIVALQPGDQVDLICTLDYEPVCSQDSDGVGVSSCDETLEFDYCRMKDFHSFNPE